MLRTGATIETPNGTLRVAPAAPSGVTLADGEFAVVSARTGQNYIGRINRVGFPHHPDLVRVALFSVTTEVAVVDGRPSVVGRRGRLQTGTARTHRANLL